MLVTGLLWGSRRLSPGPGGLLPPQTSPSGQQSIQGWHPNKRPTQSHREWRLILYTGTGWIVLYRSGLGSSYNIRVRPLQVRMVDLLWSVVWIVNALLCCVSDAGFAGSECGIRVWNFPQGSVCPALHHWPYWQVGNLAFTYNFSNTLHAIEKKIRNSVMWWNVLFVISLSHTVSVWSIGCCAPITYHVCWYSWYSTAPGVAILQVGHWTCIHANGQNGSDNFHITPPMG